MLGWALKKGLQGATGLRDAPNGGEDTTQLDAPDTPAPVFAARAIRNAIWGQPPTTERQHDVKPSKTNPTEPAPNTTATTTTTTTAVPADTRSPTKLNSILLTPGTGTSRRKRVSFGRDVKTNGNVGSSPTVARHTRGQRQTALRKALEDSRPKKPQVEESEDDAEDDGEWEDEAVCCNHELTVDLNEPHSESGKYWKAEWSRYREEAKSDIEQLVKYKANAKSYAAKKDMEAGRLSQKLKEEQAKVASMEAKVAEMTAKLAVTGKQRTDKDTASMARDLARQNSLVAEYRERVKELEARAKEAINPPGHQRIDTSPRTEQNIIEISQELRKARTELRELDRLRDEVQRLKSSLATSRERVAELEAKAAAEKASESSKVERLEKQLRTVKEESRQKDADIRKLTRDYESLKSNAKSRTAEALEVLQDKNAKIDELEKRLKDVGAVNALKQPKSFDVAMAKHSRVTHDLKSDIESLSKPSKYEKVRPINRHMRAASIDDITLDSVQRSLFMDDAKDNHALNTTRLERTQDTGLVTDWTADIPTFELQFNDKSHQEDAEKIDTKPITKVMGVPSPRRAVKGLERQSFDVDHRAVSDVLSNRINESTRRRLRRNQASDADEAIARDRNQIRNGGRLGSTRTASLAEDKATMHGALDRPTRRSRQLSSITRPVSPDNDSPAIDLVQDCYSRLGDPSVDRSSIGNASHYTLSAQRRAAARARVEQKRLERRKGSGQVLDKENVGP